jgi:hypothetical protein
MNRTKQLSLLVTLLVISIVGYAQRLQPQQAQAHSALTPMQVDKLQHSFKEVNLIRINLPELVQRARTLKTNIPVTLRSNQHEWNILIDEHELRSPDYKQEITTDSGRFEIPRDACGTFKGYVLSDPESSVRMNIRDHSFSAVINTDGKEYFIEMIKKYIPEADEEDLLVYIASDILRTPGSCGNSKLIDQIELNKKQIQPRINKISDSSQAGVPQQGMVQPNTSSNATNANSAPQAMLSQNAINCRKLEIVTDSDYDNYVSSFGLQVTNSEILDNLNFVENLFYGQFGISFAIRYQHEWTTVNDPYSVTNVCSGYDRLDQFANYWNTTSYWFYNNLARDVSILYSGIDFDGNVVGCAKIGDMSLFYNEHISNQYMIVQTNVYGGFWGTANWSVAEFLHLTGHELGHLFGANHDDGTQNLMHSVLSSTNTWTNGPTSEIQSLLGHQNTQNRLSTRHIIIPLTTSFFGGTFNGGEVYIKSNASSSFGSLSFEGVDLCEVKGTSTISVSNNGNLTIRTAPCNHNSQ